MWIKATKQRPEQSGNVLCFTKNGSIMTMYYDRIVDAFNVHYNEAYDYSGEIAVKYWQPIEKLPNNAEKIKAYSKYIKEN